MPLRLGLDIGTTSIGWCLTEYDNEHAAGSGIRGLGVRIFGYSPTGAGRDPQSGTSLAVDRREARSARRRRDRFIGRRDAFLATLVQYGLMPADADEAKLLADKDPYTLRARALEQRLEPYEIGRALFHLNQRRGFKSNRKADRKSKDNEEGKIATGAKELDRAMAEEGADTLGQFLAGRETKRVRMNSDNQGYDFYPQRRHYEYEFSRIWEEQAKHHPDLLTEAARVALHRVLFFQRPLKAQEVGVCTFVHSEKRLPRAHPLFQERRLYEEVNQLRITTPGQADEPLTLEQRDDLILELRGKREVSFKRLAQRLKLQTAQSFNKASETRTHLAGNDVYAVMSDKKRFGDRWAHLDRDQQWTIIEAVMEEENPDKLHAFLTEEWGLDDNHADAVAKAPLPELHGRLGPTATTRILEELKKEVITYDKAVERCGWHHSDDRTGEILPQLPYYGELLTREIPPGTQLPSDPPEKRWGKITNPTVHIGLRQLEKLVNAVIKVHGRPDEIVVELARELKLNEKDKEEHNKRIRRDTAAAIARGQKLSGMDAEGNQVGERVADDTGANRMLLRMWEELNPANPLDRRCPYCARQIAVHQLFNGEVQIDHIIPYSKSLDDSAANKIVAHRKCNQVKGQETPFGRWGHDEDTWDVITAQVARMHKSKQWRFGPDAMARVEKDGGFIARQLTDTQYVSRLAGRYLSALYPEAGERHVFMNTGRMTAMLRRLWALNDVLQDSEFVENKNSNAPKNRLDHRHHAIDAFVMSVMSPGLIAKVAHAAGRAEDKQLDRQFENLPEPWPGYLPELKRKLLAVTVSHKPDHGRKGKPKLGHDVTAGQLHNDTAYGLVRDPSSPDGIARNAQGLPVVVHRVPLMNLKANDLADPERIVDTVLRDALRRATKGKAGKDYERALAKFRREGSDLLDKNGDAVFLGLRHVRVLGESAGKPALSVIPIRDDKGRAYKAYKGSSNDRFEVWRMPDGKWKSIVVPTFDAHQKASKETRPHPAAKKVLSLKQKDMIAIERDAGSPEVMIVQQIWPTQINLVGHVESGNLDKRSKDENDPFKFFAPTASGLKKLKARQVRIDPLGRIFDPGPR